MHGLSVIALVMVMLVSRIEIVRLHNFILLVIDWSVAAAE